MGSDRDLFVDLQRQDGTTIAVHTLASYATLPPSAVADTVARFFVRCECGRRHDVGSSSELARALNAGAAASDLAAARVAPAPRSSW